MNQETIEVRNLSKSFGNIQAVKDLSFTVESGKITGFLGPNGAGKTTTLRMLLQLVSPDSGEALIKGQKYETLVDPMNTVGAHLDSHNVHPGRTGRDHMMIACAQGGLSTNQVQPLLEMVGMVDSADRKAGGYSLGMLQRLGLATSLLGDPSILLYDEPANGLDPEGMRWLRHFLESLADQGRTVFLSSHLLGEVQQMANDVVIIDRGQLVRAGPVEELENIDTKTVIVASNATEDLVDALTAAGFSFKSLEGSVEGREGSLPKNALQVTGVHVDGVGRVAATAGVSLTYLSEKKIGLEELFINLIGESR